ncbi:DNA replication and repair protein RecF [Patescibacteria group bacterium]|nr:DNA replication and repair protein RecF [Patescibacteria group bacterium]
MLIKSLALQNFRNFSLINFSFEKTNLIFGDNGIGKTSIIEAIYLLASADSFRAGKVEEMILLEADLGRVQGLIDLEGLGDEESEELKLEAMLTRGMVQGKKTQYRLFSVNDIRRRKKDFLAFFKAVVFRPEDLRLVEGSPSRRRSFLDTALIMISDEYRSALSRYEQTLKRRNRLLQKVNEGKDGRETLNFWNTNLVKNGEFLQAQRSNLIDFISEVVFPFELNIEYIPSIISEKKLLEHLDKEIFLGHTLIGPHKDDFLLKFSQEEKGIDDLSLLAYGSRGQQRLGVLWLKIAELQFLTDKIGYQPVLLLDDILSELDIHSKDMVLDLLSNYQTILTTADADVLADLRSRVKDLNLIIL